jgi:Arc/MetJ family transcription regulator
MPVVSPSPWLPGPDCEANVKESTPTDNNCQQFTLFYSLGEILILNRTGLDFIYKTCNFVYKEEMEMRTLVDINENVLKEAMEVSETTTKKETITLALEELIKSRLRQRLKTMAGSGIVGTGLSDLKKLRQRREKSHRVLRTVVKRRTTSSWWIPVHGYASFPIPPTIDTLIAILAIDYRCLLLQRDSHFELIARNSLLKCYQ